MFEARLGFPADFDGWREAARRALALGIAPEALSFQVGEGASGLFAEPLPGEDQAFADAIRGRPVVLGYYFSSDEGGRTIGKLPDPIFAAGALASQGLRPYSWDGYGANLVPMTQAARASGFYNARVDDDGVVRGLPLISEYKGELYESLALAVLRVYLGAHLAGRHHRAVDDRELAGGPDQGTAADRRDVRRERSGHLGQGEPELGQAVQRGH